MATIPTLENILLEINQSFGEISFSTEKKRKFSERRMQEEEYQKMFNDIFEGITNKLKLDNNAKSDIFANLLTVNHFYKLVELNTWTGNATKQQIVWLWLAYIGIPGLARHMVFWNLDDITDKGMPGGKFWYLPNIIDKNNQQILQLPVAQIVDWLLDLLGISMQELATEYRAKADHYDIKTDKVIRTLYSWKASENVPQPSKFQEFFPDSLDLEFKGCFTIQDDLPHSEQFSLALQFIKQKFDDLKRDQIAEVLSQEIPIIHEVLTNILSENSDIEMEKRFIELLAIRYAKPNPKIIRHYFLMARIAQDGYIRLLKFLFPNVDKLCTDPSKNKLLQIVLLYKHVYNLTITAHKNSHTIQEEEIYFENEISPILKQIIISISPSMKENAYLILSEILTNKFLNCDSQSEFEDIYPYNEEIMLIMAKNLEDEARNKLEEIDNVDNLLKLSPFSTSQELAALLKSETQFNVVFQFINTAHLQPQQFLITVEKLSELAQSPYEKMTTICLKLHHYLDNNPIQPDDVSQQVESLLSEAEQNSDYIAWKAPLLKYKAKHALSLNDFTQAKKLFREALNYCSEHNYGDLRSEIARDLLAIEVAKGKFIPQNHYRYYQEIVNYGMPEIGMITPEVCAEQCAQYFWETLYKPYVNRKDNL